MALSRRNFIIGSAAATGLTAFHGLKGLRNLPQVSAAETLPDIVRFSAELEPFVRLIEDTPRNKAVEVMAHQLRNGMTYRQFLGSMFLAGIRNVNPQPPGFSFHCVFMIHSCNYLAKMGPADERYLPLFLALDDFKKAQDYDIKRDEGDFVLRETIGTLPTGPQAWTEFHTAMEEWDEPRADRAITAIAREYSQEEVFEQLWEYGARDFRNIGHKIIFVAHAQRTLKEIGWENAEPTLRSLMLGLLDFGKKELVNAYAFEDQGYLGNRQLAKDSIGGLPGDWAGSDPMGSVTMELLDAMREGKIAGASRLAVGHLKAGTCKAGAVWDAVHLAAGELMMRQPGIAGIHTVTSSNAMRYGFRTSKNPQTRLLLLLQGIAWMAQFRNFMSPDKDNTNRITGLELADLSGSETKAIESIMDTVTTDQNRAAQLAFAYDEKFDSSLPLIQAARHNVCMKLREHHQVKWPAAIFEDYTLVNPEYRPHLLATSMYYLRGDGHSNSPVTERALDALA
jgi:hypothetical protein